MSNYITYGAVPPSGFTAARHKDVAAFSLTALIGGAAVGALVGGSAARGRSALAGTLAAGVLPVLVAYTGVGMTPVCEKY